MTSTRVLPRLCFAAAIALAFPLMATSQAAPATKPASLKVSPVAPRIEQVKAIVQEAYDKFKGDTRGKNADYIPALARVDSKLFGIAIVTTDNRTLTLGDAKSTFSIQSIAKVFSLALAMQEQGADKVFEKVAPSRPAARSIRRSPWSTCRATPATRSSTPAPSPRSA